MPSCNPTFVLVLPCKYLPCFACKWLLFIVLLCLWLSNTVNCKAQKPDTSFLLPPQITSAQRLIQFTPDVAVQRIDSITRAFYATSEIADLLANVTPVVVKSYGLGSLATIALRGLSAQQTAIQWNGFTLLSPMNGLADMNLVNVFFTDVFQVNFANPSSMSEAGNISGGLHFANQANYGKGVTYAATSGIGSFGKYLQNLRLGFGNAHIASSVRAQYQQSANNFSYYNNTLAGNPKMKQSNAQTQQFGLMYDFFARWHNKHELSLVAWQQGSQRQIPPPITAGTSVAQQKDDFLRITAGWKYQYGKVSVEGKSAWFTEKLLYSDSLIGLNANNKAQSSITEIETRWQAGKNYLLSLGASNLVQTARVDAYTSKKRQNQTAVFALLKAQFLSGKIQSIVSIRQGMVNLQSIPLTTSLGIQYKLSPRIELYLLGAKNYRLPTFNDLYWKPGGNARLLPENGWLQQVSISYKYKKNEASLQARLSMHSNLVNNWIEWLPTPENSMLWQAINHSKVWSRGIETALDYQQKLGKIDLRAHVMGSYQISRKLQGNSPRKQFIYIPIFAAQNNITLSYKHTALFLQQTVNGKRFTTTDNSRYLPPFALYHIWVMQSAILKKTALTLTAKLNNVFNQTYQTIEYRPMPMRYFELSVSIKR